MTRTHTYAVLEVPAVVFAAVKALLKRAEYDHAIHEASGPGDHELLDMHGIALQADAGATSEQEQRKAKIAELIGSLDDEAFVWLVLAMQPKAMTIGGRAQVWPDGLGGFRDREKMETIRTLCADYMKAAS